MRKFRGMSRGFTLIELLIVLAVIAALLAIVTPIALNAVAQANVARVAANFRNIKSALEMYVYTERATPSNLDDLVSKGYLSSKPAGFSLTYTGSTGDKYVYKIEYDGRVNLEKLQEILSEAKEESNGKVTLTATLVAWW